MDLKIIRLWERNHIQKTTYYMLHLHATLEVKVNYSDKKQISVSLGTGEVEWGIDGKGVHGTLRAEGDGSGYTGEYTC